MILRFIRFLLKVMSIKRERYLKSSSKIYYRWRKTYGGMNTTELQEFKKARKSGMHQRSERLGDRQARSWVTKTGVITGNGSGYH